MVISGVIRPPPEIRAVADKTASFVAKNGRTFENRILNSDQGQTPKFAFLHDTSPFHAYYEDRIKFYQSGGTDDDDSDAEKMKKQAEEEEAKKREEEELQKKQQEEQQRMEKTQKASALDPVARALLAQRAKIADARKAMEDSSEEMPTGPIPPPPLHYVGVEAPSNATPVQVEMIKLTAQFVALQGKGGTFLKEMSLKEWSNPDFAFLQPRHGHFAYFTALVDGYQHLLKSWMSGESNQPQTVSECLDVAAYRAEYDRDQEERHRREQEQDGGLGGAARIDWQDFVVVETLDFPVDEVVAVSLPPRPVEAAKATKESNATDQEEQEVDGIIVRNYTPKIVSSAKALTHAIDPITGKRVALADTSEHMRIQLLDPKWAEEKKKFMDKQKDSNLLSGDAIASNISRMAQARTDIFGSSDQLASEADSRKRLEEANRVIREQAQQPYQAAPPAVLPPPPPPVVLPPLPPGQPPLPPGPPPLPPGQPPAHAPPDLQLPDAKRARTDTPGAPPPPLPPPPLPPSSFPPPPTEAPPPPQVAPRELLSEADFVASLADPNVKLSIIVPDDPSNAAWQFNGQIIELSVDVMSKIKAIKEILRPMLGNMPVNKMQLKDPETGFLNDNSLTLAHLNIGPTASLDMVPKTRGGRK